MYARTLISPDWRMRGRVAIDGIILRTDDSYQAVDERKEAKDGGWLWSKANLRVLVLVGGF